MCSRQNLFFVLHGKNLKHLTPFFPNEDVSNCTYKVVRPQSISIYLYQKNDDPPHQFRLLSFPTRYLQAVLTSDIESRPMSAVTAV